LFNFSIVSSEAAFTALTKMDLHNIGGDTDHFSESRSSGQHKYQSCDA
jgi:hypothetical protein